MRTDGGCAIASFPHHAGVIPPLSWTPESQVSGANLPPNSSQLPVTHAHQPDGGAAHCVSLIAEQLSCFEACYGVTVTLP